MKPFFERKRTHESKKQKPPVMDNLTKNIIKSRTYHGLLISLLGIFVDKFGWAEFIGRDDIELLVELSIQVGGLVWAFYGRWKATKRLHVNPNVTSEQNESHPTIPPVV